jgi:hypothetical protein
MQWTNLPELRQTPAFDDSDLDCLEEIRDVLARHGKLARFAVHLAHRHFELAPGEILIERPDPDGRTQHVTVGRLDDQPEARPTTWLFEEGPEMRLSDAVYCVCVSDPNKTEQAGLLRARFDRIFKRASTGYVTLDRLLRRLFQNKDGLLRVLDRPEIPINTNASENDIRAFVTKRKISGGTVSDKGRDARDIMLGLAKTCMKLKLSFYDFIGPRLGIPGPKIPPLAGLIRPAPA